MSDRSMERLDRHALVMAIWMSFGLMALAVFRYGLADGSFIAVLSGFALVLTAFAGHVIVNAVTGIFFTPREVALALVTYVASLIAFAAAAVVSPGFREQHFLAFVLGFVALFAGVVFYMVTHLGVRRSFDSFDVIRRFRD